MCSSMVLVRGTCLTMMMCMVLGLPQTLVALTCGQINIKLAPCIAYVTGNGDVPRSCCNGIRDINNEAETKSGRQAACRCIKTTVTALRDLNVDKLADLPRKCGVNLPYKPTPSIDCNKYVHHTQY
ncbi:non-specific lipid-transfer protein [Trifolium repens]|nr:non-specific lipid-transfer protein [Trifolium repens]